MTVHEAARMLAVAQPGEVLVSSITRDLAGGADMRYVDRGEHTFKGLDAPRRLFALSKM